MRAAEQRDNHAFGEDDPVAVTRVHCRDDEPLGERIQDRAKEHPPGRTSHCPGEQVHEYLVEGRMRDAVDRTTKGLDWQGAAIVRNGDGVVAPQQNTKPQVAIRA